jgi:hypothetical protein
MAEYQATTPTATPADYPGKTLGIVGLVLAIVLPLVGIVVSAIARSQSKNAGYENNLAKIGLIVGIVLTVLGLIAGIAYVVLLGSMIGASG